jgi:hypothetical protein
VFTYSNYYNLNIQNNNNDSNVLDDSLTKFDKLLNQLIEAPEQKKIYYMYQLCLMHILLDRASSKYFVKEIIFQNLFRNNKLEIFSTDDIDTVCFKTLVGHHLPTYLLSRDLNNNNNMFDFFDTENGNPSQYLRAFTSISNNPLPSVFLNLFILDQMCQINGYLIINELQNLFLQNDVKMGVETCIINTLNSIYIYYKYIPNRYDPNQLFNNELMTKVLKENVITTIFGFNNISSPFCEIDQFGCISTPINAFFIISLMTLKIFHHSMLSNISRQKLLIIVYSMFFTKQPYTTTSLINDVFIQCGDNDDYKFIVAATCASIVELNTINYVINENENSALPVLKILYISKRDSNYNVDVKYKQYQSNILRYINLKIE